MSCEMIFFTSNSLQLPDDVGMHHFAGQIEQVAYHNDPVGLWNFAERVSCRFRKHKNAHIRYLQGSVVDVRGALQRTELDTRGASNGVTLDSGYVAIKAEKLFSRQKTAISFNFRTFASDGLLLYISKQVAFVPPYHISKSN